jgi:hypothetical protein
METAVEEKLTIGCHLLAIEGANVDERYGLISPTSCQGPCEEDFIGLSLCGAYDLD